MAGGCSQPGSLPVPAFLAREYLDVFYDTASSAEGQTQMWQRSLPH